MKVKVVVAVAGLILAAATSGVVQAADTFAEKLDVWNKAKAISTAQAADAAAASAGIPVVMCGQVSCKMATAGARGPDAANSAWEQLVAQKWQPEVKPLDFSACSSHTSVNMSHYGSVQTGMTYRHVVEIMCNYGTELSSSELGGINTSLYGWKNSDGSNMSVMFQNGRVVMKAQAGLR
jgi:hypothetical protein